MSDALGVFRQIDVNCNEDITLEEFQAWWEVRGLALTQMAHAPWRVVDFPQKGMLILHAQQ